MSGRGRGTRGGARGTRSRGNRGRGRGKKAAIVLSSDEENINLEDVSTSSANVQMDSKDDTAIPDLVKKETVDGENVIAAATQQLIEKPEKLEEARAVPQPIDMEADISQLEAPTFTTISRGPPEPMLRLKWDHKVSLIGEKVLNPMIHCCDQCNKPILVYGRMIPCKHIFCLKCARAEPVKSCPRCSDKVLRVEQSGLGTVFMCTHGGSRYGNGGCRRTYLSQRDLQAHINHRHVSQSALVTNATGTNELKQDVSDAIKTQIVQRKLSESGMQTPAAVLLSQRPQLRAAAIGTIQGPSTGVGTNLAHSHSVTALTQANLARINTANAQDCHQGKSVLHQTLKKTSHQPSETVADASYYSSVLNSFGSGTEVSSSNTSNSGMTQTQSNQTTQNSWQPNQYYR